MLPEAQLAASRDANVLLAEMPVTVSGPVPLFVIVNVAGAELPTVTLPNARLPLTAMMRVAVVAVGPVGEDEDPQAMRATSTGMGISRRVKAPGDSAVTTLRAGVRPKSCRVALPAWGVDAASPVNRYLKVRRVR
jgi:hypothetical protein